MPDIFTLAFTSYTYHNIPIYILAIRRDVIFTRHAKVYLVPRLTPAWSWLYLYAAGTISHILCSCVYA